MTRSKMLLSEYGINESDWKHLINGILMKEKLTQQKLAKNLVSRVFIRYITGVEETRPPLQLLKINGLRPHVYAKEISLMGFHELKKVELMDLFFLRPFDKLKLEKGIKTLGDKRIPMLNKSRIIELLKHSHKVSTKVIANSLGLKFDNAKKHLLELLRGEQIDRTGYKARNVLWSIRIR